MSTAQNMSRKRPAPGASPIAYGPQNQQVQSTYAQSGPLTDDQFFNWGANGDPASYPNQPMYAIPPNSYPPQAGSAPSNQGNQLARRPVNQVVPRQSQANGQWAPDQHTGAAGQQQPQQQEMPTTWSDDINELVAKAQVAKREAQSKRKQIPPFVLKLHR